MSDLDIDVLFYLLNKIDGTVYAEDGHLVVERRGHKHRVMLRGIPPSERPTIEGRDRNE